ncbi:MAG: nitroreductase [Zetaproteobacteria bacterium]|nr:MAG: nitroreductase [Zetaproteobacteria bacterium]
MHVREALRARKSVRAYLDKPVPRALIEALLDDARHAPSGANIQPWQVAVVSGASKLRLQRALLAAFEAGEPARMDYRYYPEHWRSPYRERRRRCGLQLYRAVGIEREDQARRRAQWAANYRAFDAPVFMFFFLDGDMQTGAWLDYGMFLQSLMLAAVEHGLATCVQASLAEYPDIVKRVLGYPESSVLVCGMALGYEDRAAPINGYRTTREDVHTFARFFDSNEE